MEKINISKEIVQFFSIALLRSATVIFFILLYEAFHTHDGVEFFLLMISIYIFTTTVIIANITNYCLVNKITFSNIFDSKFLLIFCICTSVIFGFFNPLFFLFCGGILNLTTVNYEVSILRRGRITLYSIMTSLRFLIAVSVLIINFTVIDIDIKVMYSVFFVSDVIKAVYVYKENGKIHKSANNFQIAPFLFKLAPILSLGAGFLSIRTVAATLWEDYYLELDATLRLIEICISLSTLYFVQRFQINLSHNRHDYASVFTSVVVYTFGMAICFIIKVAHINIQMLEIIKFDLQIFAAVIFVGFTVLGSIYGSKLFLKLKGSYDVLFLLFSFMYLIIAALIPFITNDIYLLLISVGIANLSLTGVILYLYAYTPK